MESKLKQSYYYETDIRNTWAQLNQLILSNNQLKNK